MQITTNLQILPEKIEYDLLGANAQIYFIPLENSNLKIALW